LQWGSPTATTPFEPLDFAPALMSTSRMRSSILGIYHLGGVFHPIATNIGQFDKLTDRSEGTLVPELAEGALPKPYIYTVAYASGSVRSVLIPWQILLLILGLISVLIRG